MKKVFLILVTIVFSLQSFAQMADDILGQWKNEKEDRIIEIYKNNDLYYGKVIWIKDSEKGFGENRLDVKNPNKSLNSRSIIGIDYLMGFSYFTDREVWKEGHIYNYESGNTYTGKINLDGGELRLKGYYGFLWFLGRTQIWNRVEE